MTLQSNTHTSDPPGNVPPCPPLPSPDDPYAVRQHKKFTYLDWWDERIRGGPWIATDGKIYVVTIRAVDEFIDILKRSHFRWDPDRRLWWRKAGSQPELALERLQSFYTQYCPHAHSWRAHEAKLPANFSTEGLVTLGKIMGKSARYLYR